MKIRTGGVATIVRFSFRFEYLFPLFGGRRFTCPCRTDSAGPQVKHDRLGLIGMAHDKANQNGCHGSAAKLACFQCELGVQRGPDDARSRIPVQARGAAGFASPQVSVLHHLAQADPVPRRQVHDFRPGTHKRCLLMPFLIFMLLCSAACRFMIRVTSRASDTSGDATVLLYLRSNHDRRMAVTTRLVWQRSPAGASEGRRGIRLPGEDEQHGLRLG